MIQLPWHKEEDAVDCGKTQSCAVNATASRSSCAAFSAGLNLDASILGHIATFFGISLSYSNKNCVSLNTTKSCSWSDQLCHSVWVSHQVKRVHGYVQRQCNWHGDDRGEVTVWSHDVVIDIPTGKGTFGCSALCKDKSYPFSNLVADSASLPKLAVPCTTGNPKDHTKARTATKTAKAKSQSVALATDSADIVSGGNTALPAQSTSANSQSTPTATTVGPNAATLSGKPSSTGLSKSSGIRAWTRIGAEALSLLLFCLI
jgi:hypothetical protein